MKKFNLTLILMFSLFTLATAQFTKIGGGLALSSGFPFHNMEWNYNKSGKVAASFKSIYEISLPFHLSPSFTIFYPNITKTISEKTVVSSIMFDINGHYVFNSLDKFEFSGLAGFDILFAKKKHTISGNPSDTESDNALGLNIGAGTYIKMTEKLNLYGEAKYVFNNKYNQFMLNIGILVEIKKSE
jgi:hypothetical protein